MKPLVLLLPPSEGKASGGGLRHTNDTFHESLTTARENLVRAYVSAVQRASRPQREKILGVRGPLLATALTNVALLAAGEAPRLPAWQRYAGVVWEFLEPGNLTPAQRRRILVPSGLYGLTTADDAIADYRLKMDVTLPRVGRVADYWRESVTRLVETKLTRNVVVDLLPNEHRRAVGPAATEHENFRRIDFVSATGTSAAGHAAKAVKGVLAGELLAGGWGVLADFRWEGWRTRATEVGYTVVAPK